MPKNFMIDLVRKTFRIVFEISLYLAAVGVIIASLFTLTQGWIGFLLMPFVLVIGAAAIVMYGGFISIIINIDKNLERIANGVGKDTEPSKDTLREIFGATAENTDNL